MINPYLVAPSLVPGMSEKNQFPTEFWCFFSGMIPGALWPVRTLEPNFPSDEKAVCMPVYWVIVGRSSPSILWLYNYIFVSCGLVYLHVSSSARRSEPQRPTKKSPWVITISNLSSSSHFPKHFFFWASPVSPGLPGLPGVGVRSSWPRPAASAVAAWTATCCLASLPRRSPRALREDSCEAAPGDPRWPTVFWCWAG